MNNVTLVGRLTKNPELKFAQGTGTAVATFTLAVNKRFKREGEPDADFINIVCFGKTAEATANYMTKGKLVSLVGSISTRNYEAKDGTRKYVTEVIANEVNFLEKGEKTEHTPTKQNEDVTPIDDLSDIPFK